MIPVCATEPVPIFPLTQRCSIRPTLTIGWTLGIAAVRFGRPFRLTPPLGAVELHRRHARRFRKATPSTIVTLSQPMSDDSNSFRVLVIDDDPVAAECIADLLNGSPGTESGRRDSFETTMVGSLPLAQETLAVKAFHVVLLRIDRSAIRWSKALEIIHAANEETAVVAIGGKDDDSLALAAIRRGVQDFLVHAALSPLGLRRVILYAVERKRASVHLERVNRELDDFTTIASHDLKEPLRGISAYCEVLLEDYGHSLDDDGHRRMAAMMDLCKRLENQIDDLLTYCRLGARPADRQVDLNSVVAEVIDALRPAIDRRNGEVHLTDTLPIITGEATLLGMAVGNLISNGLKFNESPRPRVEIGVVAGHPQTIYIRDNGIGIPAKHHQDIFTIFRRLHSRRKYGGTGAGLTIVRKIVHSHGGRIWLDSRPGEGTTFYLALGVPDQPAPAAPTLGHPHWSARPAAVTGGERRRPAGNGGRVRRSARR